MFGVMWGYKEGLTGGILLKTKNAGGDATRLKESK